MLFGLEVHPIIDYCFVKEIVCGKCVLFLDVEFIVEGRTHTDLGSLTKILELSQKLGGHLAGRGLPFDMALAVYFFPVFCNIAEQKFIFVANAVIDCFGGGLQFSLLADVKQIDISSSEVLDSLNVVF